MEGREHMLPQPKGLLALRIIQLVLAVALLALAAFGMAAYNFSYDGVDMVLFSAIASIIIVVYVIVAMTALPAAYNYWAILGVDIFAAVFWIISFSLLASEVARLNTAIHAVEECTYTYFGVCYRKREIAKRWVDVLTYRDAMAATSALGGVEFLLFTIGIILTGLAIQKHRANGGHCTTATTTSASVAETKYEQPESTQQYTPQEQQYPPQPAQQYPPQPAQQYPPQPQQQYPPQPQQQQYPPQQAPVYQSPA